MRFHYAYVAPYGSANIVITGECNTDNCPEQYHLVVEQKRHAPDCKCSGCYIPRV